MREFSHSLSINAPPAAVLDAFFDPDALAVWWDAARAVCVPRPFGAFAVEWKPTEQRDELLGPLGGSVHGTVIEFRPGETFFVADLYWTPPEGDPIGPMALEATCRSDNGQAVLQLRQSGGEDDSPRWSRYYDVTSAGWMTSLQALKSYLEDRWK